MSKKKSPHHEHPKQAKASRDLRQRPSLALRVTRLFTAAPGWWVFLGAWLLRILYLLDSANAPTFLLPIVDAEVYDQAARDFLAGKGLSEAFFFQPFFYPFFVSLCYGLSAGSMLFVKVLQTVLGATTCFLVYRLGLKLFSRPIGVLASLLCATYAPLMFFEGELLGTGWAAFWSIALLLLFSKALESRRILWLILLGLGGALATLCRPVFLPFFLLTSLSLLSLKKDFSRARLFGYLLLVLMSFAVGVFPVAVQAKKLTGQARFLPASGGLNAYLGNNPDRCKTLRLRPGSDWNRLTALPQSEGAKDIWQRQQWFYDKTWDYAWGQPGDFLQGLGEKTLNFISPRELPRNIDLYLFRDWSVLLRTLMWKWGGFAFPFGLLFPLAILGLLIRHKAFPLSYWLFLVLYPTAVILIFCSARYRAPYIPILCIPAAVALVHGYTAIRHRKFKAILLALAVLISGGMLLASLPPACQEDGNFRAEYCFMVGAAHERRGENAPAQALFSQAIALDADYFEAHHQLGRLLLKNDSLQEATPILARSVQLRPENPDAQADYGECLGKQGALRQARKHLKIALDLAPTKSDTWNNLGIVMAQLGELPAAAQHFEEALRLDPENREIQSNLNRAHRALRKRKQ